jgi:pSer/pThr/pTyr-binding forkhead associated (FHA) protein
MCPEYVATSRDSSADRTLEFGEGRFIFHQGDLGTEMYIIHEGEVEILQDHATGPRQIAVLERGDFFGEMSILEELPRNASARALTDVKVIMIDGATFDGMLRANPEIGIRIMRKLSRRVRQTDALLNRSIQGQEPELVEEPSLAVPVQPSIARLVHAASGGEFGLPAEGATTIGRRDPVTGIQPDVDLTPIDPERSSSRRHAKIYREGEQFLLVEDIGATNGTFIDDSRIRTGIPTKMDHGKTIRFGLVELEFQID